MVSSAKVVFTPSGRRGTFALGTPLLEAARQIGVDIASICGGRGMCGRCQILCGEGSFPKHGITSTAEHLTPLTTTECEYSERRKPLAPGRRLSCQARIRGDLVIDVPPDSQIHRQVVRKHADARSIEIDPVIQLYYVTVDEAKLPNSDVGHGTRLDAHPASDREMSPNSPPADSINSQSTSSETSRLTVTASQQVAARQSVAGLNSRPVAQSNPIAGPSPSRSPAEPDFLRGASPSRSPAEPASLRGAGPSRSPAEGSDLARLREALRAQWGLDGLEIGVPVLAGLQEALRQGGWSVTVAVHRDREIIAVWAGYRDEGYGLAVDVGSTTIAAHLCALSSGAVVCSDGMMNPQIRFGEDLMSRVSYAMMHSEGSHEMTFAVRSAVNELIARLCADADIERAAILSLVVVGNPVMHHLLLGISPVELGGAPFALAVDGSVAAAARDLDVQINPGGVAYLLPCIAGHVGADAAGVILAEQPHEREEVSLIVDIGTNAEIVLGNRQRLLACSSPTGPAFEGAQISCGQRAAPGAIERVRIDPETLETRIKVIGSDLWSDHPTFAQALPGGRVTGICGSGIIEAIGEMYLAGVLTADGVIDATHPDPQRRIVQNGRTHSFVLFRGRSDAKTVISVTQTDVRQIQLAKAALYAGAKLLMDKLGVDRVERIRLAGAFGSHIDVKYAMVLGLIPDCPLDKASAAGNAAGTGARIALLNQAARAEIEAVVHQIERVETAVEPNFQDYFVAAMAIPHKHDSFPNLAETLPPPANNQSNSKRSAATSTNRRRRRRRR